MSRITLILFIALFMSGCSSIRKAGNIFYKEGEELINVEDITGVNISNYDFDIEKAEIEIVNNSNKQVLLASLKYRKEGNYLLSIRIKAGFEIARFYLTKDTILINDKFNRKIYSASPSWLNEKYGISMAALPVIFGDYIRWNNINNPLLKCTNGLVETEEKILNKDIRYKIDCKVTKVSGAQFGEIGKDESIMFSYEDYQNNENFVFPGKIVFRDTSKNIIITIHIEKIKFNGLENIYFIPGKNYEGVMLK